MSIKMVNQIFDYTRCVTPKRVASYNLRVIASRQHSFAFEEISHRLRAVGNIVSKLTGPRSETQISSSRDERTIT